MIDIFSKAEKDRRLKAADDLMKKEGLTALLLLGNGATGTTSYGCFRYLVDNKTFYYVQAAIFSPGREPVSLASSLISKLEFMSKSFVPNCRIAPDPIAGIIGVFRDLGIHAGKVGTILDLLPTSWLLPIRQAYPEIEFVDVTAPIVELRSNRSAEEITALRKPAELCDIGYKTVCDIARPGMTERELVSELEYAVLKNGGENNVTLIASGKLGPADQKMPFLHSVSLTDNVINAGDTVTIESAPCCNGYWSHYVRTVCMGEQSALVAEIHKVATGALQDVLQELKPGNTVGAIPRRIKKFAESAGYAVAGPCGHFCGLDMNEGLLEESSTRPLVPGMAVAIHPAFMIPGLDNGTYWGDTFLITENGFEQVTGTDRQLRSVHG